jgi:hypothetical protein
MRLNRELGIVPVAAVCDRRQIDSEQQTECWSIGENPEQEPTELTSRFGIGTVQKIRNLPRRSQAKAGPQLRSHPVKPSQTPSHPVALIPLTVIPLTIQSHPFKPSRTSSDLVKASQTILRPCQPWPTQSDQSDPTVPTDPLQIRNRQLEAELRPIRNSGRTQSNPVKPSQSAFHPPSLGHGSRGHHHIL